MTGSDALAGYRYQLQRTLESVFDELQSDDGSDWHVLVESPSRRSGDETDTDVIDFSIVSQRDGRSLIAQVKGGRQGSTIGVAELAHCIFRLAGAGVTDRRVLLTNRGPLEGALKLLHRLDVVEVDADRIRAIFSEELKAAPKRLAYLKALTSDQLLRCKQVVVRFDDRQYGEVDEALRARTRTLRALVGSQVGWTAAGLLYSALMQQLLWFATEGVGEALTSRYLREILRIDAAAIYSSMLVRDWGNIFGRPALPGDVARVKELSALRGALVDEKRERVPNVCKVVGPSGIGKSAIAAAYALEYGDCYERIYWIEAADHATLHSQVSHAIGNSDAREEPLSEVEVSTNFHRSLANAAEPWLLILDNIVSQEIVGKWVPTSGNGSVIATTIDRGIRMPGRTVDVAAMSPEESMELLSARFQRDTSLKGEARDSALKELATGLSYWPLAMEIASTYMASCEIDLADARTYLDRLRHRSLGDTYSVPFNYPRTLVAAIRLSLARLRKEDDLASALAHAVLVNASYLLPRQVPVHLLLQASILNPREAVDDDLHIPSEYTGYPPFEEITRSLHRYSLCRRDDALLIPSESRAAPTAPVVRYTINVNEVVQEVVRAETEAAGDTETVIGNLAFFLQQWVAYFRDLDVDLYEIEGHATHLALFAIGKELDSYNVALLCGNTATRLADRQRYHEAELLYRAEIACLSKRSEVSTLWVQTLVSLAMVQIQGADSVDLVAHDVIRLLGRALPAIPRVEDDQHEQLAAAVQTALQMLSLPAVSKEKPHEVLELTMLARALAETLPPRHQLDPVIVSIKANELLVQGNFKRIVELVDACRREFPQVPRRVKVQLDRYSAEAFAGLEQWSLAEGYIDKLREALEEGVLDYETSALAVVNVGMSAVLGMQGEEPGAAALYGSCERLSQVHIRKLGSFRPTDEARRLMLVVGAADARGDSRLAETTFKNVDRDDLEAVSNQDPTGWLTLYDFFRDQYLK